MIYERFSFPEDIVIVENPISKKAIIYNFDTRKEIEVNMDAVNLLEVLVSGVTLHKLINNLPQGREELVRELKEFVIQMVEQGWLVRSECPNPYVKKTIKTNPVLSLIQWELTTKCNLHCLHCYNNSGDEVTKDLPTEDIFRIIDEADELGIWQFDLTGGEMFMRDDILDILEYFYKKRIIVRVASNGTLLTNEHIEGMKEYKVRSYATSIDGGSPASHDRFRGVKGSYDLALSNLKKVKENGIPIRRVNVTVTNLNYHEMDYIEDLYVNQLNVPYVVDNIVGTGRGEKAAKLNVNDDQLIKAKLKCFIATNGLKISKDFLELLDEPTHGDFIPSCGVFADRLFITSEGIFSICPTLSPREDHMFVLGKYPQDTIKYAWEEANLWKNGLRNINCRNIGNCKYAKVCRGGCRSRAYLNSGNFDEPDYIMCEVMKKFEERAIKYGNY